MKKIILFLVFTVTISGSLFAQKNVDKRVNTYVKAVESKTTLTPAEKAKIVVLKKEHFIFLVEITKNYKGKPEFKEKRKDANKKFNTALINAFGKERAKEIRLASKKKKKEKK